MTRMVSTALEIEFTRKEKSRNLSRSCTKLYEVILCRVYSVEELSNVITSKIIIESAVVS